MEPAPSSDRFERLNRILNDALALPPSEREPFILGECGDDKELLHSALSLCALASRSEDRTRTVSVGPSLKTGDVLEGGYRIVGLLGRGGMGEVYEAEDPEMDERVAIKTIRPEIAAEESSIARFRREIQLGRKVNHPNVCNIYSIGKHGLIYFFTMELLRGETLSARLKKRGPMRPAEALTLLSQMADALAAAHECGIIHRDFKPGNVMLLEGDARRKAVVTDFGLARLAESGDAEAHTGSMRFAGTPAYMAPEQLDDTPLTPAADIYALGLVAYEMVTGRRPFEGSTDFGAAIQRLTMKPAPPVTWAPDLDPCWNSAILRCLERDPHDRWNTARDFAEALNGTVEIPKTATNVPNRSTRLHWWRWAAPAIMLSAAALAFWILRKPAPVTTEATELLEKGTASIRDGVYWTATTQLDGALKIDQNLAMAYARRAEAWNELDCPDRATADIARAYAHASHLSGLDRLYLEAINQTVANQPASAVDKYKGILDKLPDGQKHFGHVDLGRAYEADANPPKATQEYQTAIKEWPSSPGAWLRRGVLEGKGSKDNDAERSMEQALEIYRQNDETEGEVQAKFELARLAGASAAADPLLVSALNMAHESIFQQVTIELQRSYVAAQQGRLQDAVRLAEHAKRVADDNGMPALGARALHDLGNAAYSFGRRTEAESYYRRAIAIAQTYHAERLENAVKAMLGQMLNRRQPELAKSYLESSRSWFQAHGLARLAANGELMLARINRDQGDYPAAKVKLAHVRGETQDPAIIGIAFRDLSALELQLEDYPAAVEQALAARDVDMKAGQSAGADDQRLSAAFLMGGRISEARKALDAARKDGMTEDDLILDRALVALVGGNSRSAIQYSDKALRASDPDPGDVIEAKRIKCLALVSAGSADPARAACDDAANASKAGPRASSLSVRLAQARLALRSKDSIGTLNSSAPLVQELEHNGQRDSLWRCLAFQAAAADVQNNIALATIAAGKSRETFDSLLRSLGTANAGSFRALPETRSDLAVLQNIELHLKGRAK